MNMKYLFLPLLLLSISSSLYASEDEDKLRLLFQMSLEELVETKVSSASTYLEKEVEAPAVVNSIKQSAIKRYGYRNLFDALSYESGVYIAQDSNEMIFSQRGAFATTTQKSLFMRDGYRLNNTLFNSVAIDNSLSMQTIDSVEILRGSAGSIYGDTALTGVVSINSLPYYSEDGLFAGMTVGDYNTLGGDITYKNGRLLAWAHYLNVRGEKVGVNAENDYAKNKISAEQVINRIPDNFDVGFKYDTQMYTLNANYTKNRRLPERSVRGQLLEPVDYTLFNIYQEVKQGHIGFTAKPIYRDIVFELKHYADKSEIVSPQVLSVHRDGSYLGLQIDALDYSYGIDYRAKYYTDNHTLLGGFKVEMNDFSRINNALVSDSSVNRYDMPADKEWRYSGYVQDKYRVNDSFILNLGLRYDYFEHIDSEFSPRVALNYYLDKKSVIKLIYSHAFLSPLYFYRNANPALGYGSSKDLDPEQSDSYQLVYQTILADSINARLTLYRSEYKNMVVRNKDIYINLGSLDVGGVEAELKYSSDEMLEWFVNYSYLRVLDNSSDVTNVSNNDVLGYPTSMLKGGISYLLLKDYNLYISPTFQAISSVTNPNLEKNGGYFIANLNLFARVNKNLELSFGIYNLTDTEYAIGGSVNPYPQHGRNYLAKVGWHF